MNYTDQQLSAARNAGYTGKTAEAYLMLAASHSPATIKAVCDMMQQLEDGTCVDPTLCPWKDDHEPKAKLQRTRAELKRAMELDQQGKPPWRPRAIVVNEGV